MADPKASSPRVAIVTGAASGIGRAIAIRLSKDGYTVVLSDLPSQSEEVDEVIKEIRSTGNGTDGANDGLVNIPCDVTKEEDVQHLVDETVRTFGHLDCMVANAGVLHFEQLLGVTLEDYNRVMTTNSTGVFLCYCAAAKAMIACGSAKGGRIIGASSQAGKAGYPFTGPYSASKFAIRALTQTAAQEWGPTGITVNAYAPGFINTPMLTKAAPAIQKAVGMSVDDFAKQVVQQSALKRIGHVEDVANLVSFLASDQSSYITGQAISVDGGGHMD